MHTKTSSIKQTKSLFPLWATGTQKITWFRLNMPNLFAITPTSFKSSLTLASTSHTSQPPAHGSSPASIFWSPSFQSTHCYFLGGSSQSTIGGCQGSNPCTIIISLLLTTTYLNNRVLLQQHHSKHVHESKLGGTFHFMYDGWESCLWHIFSHRLTLVSKRPYHW